MGTLGIIPATVISDIAELLASNLPPTQCFFNPTFRYLAGFCIQYGRVIYTRIYG